MKKGDYELNIINQNKLIKKTNFIKKNDENNTYKNHNINIFNNN